MAITTQSNRPFVQDEIQSSFIQRLVHDQLLPEAFWYNVSDFGHGDSLRIPNIGEAKIQEVNEDTPIKYNPIETGAVYLQIQNHKGDAWYVTQEMKEDGTDVAALLAARSQESARALAEEYESLALSTLNAGSLSAPASHVINGRAHRVAGSDATVAGQIAVADFNYMGLVFDEAQMPIGGRVAIVAPAQASYLWDKFNGAYNVDSNSVLQGVLEGGFARDHRFVMNIAGWDVMTSNRLPVVTETLNDKDGTSRAVTGGRACIFMCIADDNCKPLMGAWRRPPTTKTEFNKDVGGGRDETVVTSRYGWGVKRVDSLGVLVCSQALA